MGGDPARRRPAARPGPVAGGDPARRPAGDDPGTGGRSRSGGGTTSRRRRASGAGAPADAPTEAPVPGSRVVRVVPDVPAIHRPFDYVVPSSMAAQVAVGSEVRVVLHGRRVRGWVQAVDVEPPAGVELRPVVAVRGVGPPASVLDLAGWAAWRWAGPPVAFLRTASSPTVVRQLPPAPGPPSDAGRQATPAPPPADGGASPSGAPSAAGSASAGPAGEPDRLVVEALAGGTAVVRVAPAADRRPLLRAAAERLTRPGVAGAGVLVLVPETEDVPPAAAQLRATGLPVAVLPGDWARARAGGCAVVGTRAAAWAPLPALAGAVVLDAHDGAYVEQRAPTWSAWEVVAERARRDGAPCLLVTPCPTVVLLGAGRVVAAPRAEERAGWPPVEVVDLRSGDPRHGLLSPRVAELGRWAVAEPGRRVAMVVNRTGGARLVACAACGEIARCETCRGSLELVEEPAPRLACRRCGAERPVVCARCGSTATRALRPGVRKLTRDLQALVGAPVLEVTAASRADAHVDPSTAPLVVGTEAALRGEGHLDAVVFLDIDGELLAPRLRAAEDVLAGLARAARRLRRSRLPVTAGRAPGRLLVQTRQPDHPALRAAVAGDPQVLTDEEAPLRRALRLPPEAALALVSGPGAGELASAVRRAVDEGAGGGTVELDGPADGVWTLRAPEHRLLADLLAAVPRPAERVRVDVDPVDL